MKKAIKEEVIKEKVIKEEVIKEKSPSELLKEQSDNELDNLKKEKDAVILSLKKIKLQKEINKLNNHKFWYKLGLAKEKDYE